MPGLSRRRVLVDDTACRLGSDQLQRVEQRLDAERPSGRRQASVAVLTRAKGSHRARGFSEFGKQRSRDIPNS
jgi:hypothetical protein